MFMNLWTTESFHFPMFWHLNFNFSVVRPEFDSSNLINLRNNLTFFVLQLVYHGLDFAHCPVHNSVKLGRGGQGVDLKSTRFNWKASLRLRPFPVASMSWGNMGYWFFQVRDIKLDRFLAKKWYPQRKILFGAKLSKIVQHFRKLKCQKLK